MQIFTDKTFITGVEYRDPTTGNPVDGSIIIPDDSVAGKRIRNGDDFTLTNGTIKFNGKKRPMKTEAEREEELEREREVREKRARKRERLRTLVVNAVKGKKHKQINDKELRGLIMLMAHDMGYLSDDELPEIPDDLNSL